MSNLEVSMTASYRIEATGKKTSPFFEGLQIYLQSFKAWRIWLYMAYAEIRRRYRRTLLGPFWVTLSIAIFIGMMGAVFPALWHIEVKTYVPFFASGYIVWTFVSSMLNEASGTFVDHTSLIKQSRLPYGIFANTVVMRNVITLLHHLIVYVLIVFIFSVPVGLNTLLFIPGLFMLCLIGNWVCLLLGMLVSRYRDIKQIIASLIQISMFITPIFWAPEQLGTGVKARLLVELNPLFHVIQIVRAPLLNQLPSLSNWLVSCGLCLLGLSFTLILLGKYKKHIVFWL